MYVVTGKSYPILSVPSPSHHFPKTSSPSKHQCSPSTTCPVQLSDIGRTYHSFPRGTFHTQFSPPIVPEFVLRYFVAHPFMWTRISTRAGPSAGKSFQVPTIPISCQKNSHKAVQWVVAAFHLFKTHLNPVALDAESGKVLPAWVRLYQNNFLIHLQDQAKAISSPSQPPALPRAGALGATSPTPTPTPSTSEAVEPRQELRNPHWELQGLRWESHNVYQ